MDSLVDEVHSFEYTKIEVDRKEVPTYKANAGDYLKVLRFNTRTKCIAFHLELPDCLESTLIVIPFYKIQTASLHTVKPSETSGMLTILIKSILGSSFDKLYGITFKRVTFYFELGVMQEYANFYITFFKTDLHSLYFMDPVVAEDDKSEPDQLSTPDEQTESNKTYETIANDSYDFLNEDYSSVHSSASTVRKYMKWIELCSVECLLSALLKSPSNESRQENMDSDEVSTEFINLDQSREETDTNVNDSGNQNKSTTFFTVQSDVEEPESERKDSKNIENHVKEDVSIHLLNVCHFAVRNEDFHASCKDAGNNIVVQEMNQFNESTLEGNETQVNSKISQPSSDESSPKTQNTLSDSTASPTIKSPTKRSLCIVDAELFPKLRRLSLDIGNKILDSETSHVNEDVDKQAISKLSQHSFVHSSPVIENVSVDNIGTTGARYTLTPPSLSPIEALSVIVDKDEERPSSLDIGTNDFHSETSQFKECTLRDHEREIFPKIHQRSIVESSPINNISSDTTESTDKTSALSTISSTKPSFHVVEQEELPPKIRQLSFSIENKNLYKKTSQSIEGKGQEIAANSKISRRSIAKISPGIDNILSEKNYITDIPLTLTPSTVNPIEPLFDIAEEDVEVPKERRLSLDIEREELHTGTSQFKEGSLKGQEKEVNPKISQRFLARSSLATQSTSSNKTDGLTNKSLVVLPPIKIVSKPSFDVVEEEEQSPKIRQLSLSIGNKNLNKKTSQFTEATPKCQALEVSSKIRQRSVAQSSPVMHSTSNVYTGSTDKTSALSPPIENSTKPSFDIRDEDEDVSLKRRSSLDIGNEDFHTETSQFKECTLRGQEKECVPKIGQQSIVQSSPAMNNISSDTTGSTDKTSVLSSATKSQVKSSFHIVEQEELPLKIRQLSLSIGYKNLCKKTSQFTEGKVIEIEVTSKISQLSIAQNFPAIHKTISVNTASSGKTSAESPPTETLTKPSFDIVEEEEELPLKISQLDRGNKNFDKNRNQFTVGTLKGQEIKIHSIITRRCFAQSSSSTQNTSRNTTTGLTDKTGAFSPPTETPTKASYDIVEDEEEEEEVPPKIRKLSLGMVNKNLDRNTSPFAEGTLKRQEREVNSTLSQRSIVRSLPATNKTPSVYTSSSDIVSAFSHSTKNSSEPSFDIVDKPLKKSRMSLSTEKQYTSRDNIDNKVILQCRLVELLAEFKADALELKKLLHKFYYSKRQRKYSKCVF